MKLNYRPAIMAGVRLFMLFVLVAFLGACEDNNCIKGAGSVESRILELQPFSKVEANGDFKVFITQGATQRIEVKGEPNILSQLRTTIHNDTWKIEHRDCVRRSKEVEVYITIPAVQSLYLNGSGRIFSQSALTANELQVGLNGSGKIDLEVTAANLITRLSGSGDIVLQGDAPLQTVTISGSGKVKAFDLTSDNSTVNLSGSGNAEVSAANALNVSISGSGNVYYKGNPAITQHTSGSGRVVKR